jgi:hypothetical protein
VAAPTLLDYAESTWSGTSNTDEVTDDLDWSASGDLIIVLGCTEDNARAFNTATATGLTFAAMSGTPTNTGSSCKAYAWTATASGNGNSTVTGPIADGVTAARGISAWAWTGSGGFGTAVVNVGTGATVSVTVEADSSVVMVLGDWNATSDVTVTTTPAGGTQREAVATSGATFLVIQWDNQTAGTRSYGVTGWTGTGTISKIAVEVKGIAAAAASLPVVRRPNMGALLQL